METLKVLFWLLMTIGMIKTTRAQSGVDMTLAEKLITNSSKYLAMDTTNTTVNREVKTTFPASGFITEESEMNKNTSYINLETKASNEIALKKQSSEGHAIKHTTISPETMESSNVEFSATENMLHVGEDNFHEHFSSDNEKEKTFISTDTLFSDSLLQPQINISTSILSARYSETRNEKNGGTVSDVEEISNDRVFSKTTSFPELSETKPLKTEASSEEISESKTTEYSYFSEEKVNTDIFQAATPFTKSFSVDSTGSDYFDAEDDQTAPEVKTDNSDLEVLSVGDLTNQELKSDYLQKQPMSEISISPLATTQSPDLEGKGKEKYNNFTNGSEEEQSESRDSLSTAEVELIYANNNTVEGDSINGTGIRSETTEEQTVTNETIAYAFEEENHNNEDLWLKIKDSSAEIGSKLNETEDKTETVESFTIKNITEEHIVDEYTKTTSGSDNEQHSKSTEITNFDGTYFTSEDTVTKSHERREDITLSSSEISKSTDVASDTENNSTRIPKRIQEPRYTETRYRPRPARPDPGYSYSDDSDSSHPYRPDDLLYSPGQKPAGDSYSPHRREPDFSRPSRPDPYVPVEDFSRHAPDYSKQSSSDSEVLKPYRPQMSFTRPYVSQGSFGRPHRPDKDPLKHISLPDFYSKTTEGLPLSSKADTVSSAASQAKTDFSESGDYDGKLSEPREFEHQRPHSDAKPIVLTPDVFRPYRAPLDTRPSLDREGDLSRPLRPVYLPSSSTVADSDISKSATSEFISKPASKQDADDVISRVVPSIQSTKSGDKSRPSGSYPRPGFGSNYGQPTGNSPKPFTPGTITLARNNLTRVEYIKADCFDNHMKVSIRFNGSFSGLVYSSGYSQDSTCSYINGSGRYHYEFFIRLNRCGTLGQQEVADQRVDTVTRRRQDRAQYLVNTVTVQYNPVIEEEIDEHFRVTCEYGYDFWKTVTFPVVSVESSAMKVRTGSPVVFTLPPPQCNMEIRTGYGPSGSRVSGPVNVGDPLTLVIHMKSESAGFDILVSNCFAHNGAQKRLQLIDSNGCVVQEKLISAFRGVSSPDRSQQVTLYSYLKAFRFTGSPALYIECDVHMCHGSCPPQRCYWRHLYKRSAENLTAISTDDPLISESVSLFQSLEVRNDESDRPNSLAVSSTDGGSDEDLVCFRAAGFAAILACLLVLLVVTCFTSICLCSRMRKMKTYFESQDTKHFIQFDINTQRK